MDHIKHESMELMANAGVEYMVTPRKRNGFKSRPLDNLSWDPLTYLVAISVSSEQGAVSGKQ